MRKQTFTKIKKTLVLLLAVFFVITFMAASASACTTKVADNIPVNTPVVNPVTNPVTDANGLTEAQKTALGDQLLDWADNNWFGKGNGNSCGCDNGDDDWFDNDWFDN
jgi:hypothetical protein